MTKIDGPFLAPASGKADSLVIFLHGYGANGADLLSIGEEWAHELPNTAFASPNAPSVCDAFSAGFQWFPIRAVDRHLIERDRPMDSVMPALNAYIDDLLAQWGVREERLIVAGFSQGAMMAMYVMPRRKTACAGIIGYSGLLVGAEGLKEEGISKMPVLAIHGDADEVVPPQCLAEVEAGFEAAGFNVETVMRPHLGHGIDHFGLMRGLQFCHECLDKKA